MSKHQKMIDNHIFSSRHWFWFSLHTLYHGSGAAFLQAAYAGPECGAERCRSWNSRLSNPDPDPPGAPGLEGHSVDPLRNSPQSVCMRGLDVSSGPRQTSAPDASALLCTTPKHHFPRNVYSKSLLEFWLYCDIHVLAILCNGPRFFF